jgi:hypothetical protein
VGSFEATVKRQQSDFRKALYWSWYTLLAVDGALAFLTPAISIIDKA